MKSEAIRWDGCGVVSIFELTGGDVVNIRRNE
jgi:hypothetical protein